MAFDELVHVALHSCTRFATASSICGPTACVRCRPKILLLRFVAIAVLKRLPSALPTGNYLKTMSRLLLVALMAVLGVVSGFAPVANSGELLS